MKRLCANRPGRAFRRWLSAMKVVLPGVTVAAAVGASAMGGAQLLDGIGVTEISAALMALVVGLMIGNAFRVPVRWNPGLAFATAKLLRVGIILLGIRLSLFDVLRLGAMAIPIVLVCIAAGWGVSRWMGSRLGISEKLGTLIGMGTSICGVSAIVAAGPTIEAKAEEVAYAVAVITVFGLAATMTYPYVAGPLFGGRPLEIGLFLGTAIHDTSQVTGAAMVYADLHQSPQAMNAAIVVKMVRNVFMVFLLPIVAMAHARQAARSDRGRVSVRAALPLFIVGFLALATLRTIGDVGVRAGSLALRVWSEAQWSEVVAAVKQTAAAFLVVALAGVGLSTRLRRLAVLGWRPFFVGLCAAVAVAATGLAGAKLLGVFSGPGVGGP